MAADAHPVVVSLTLALLLTANAVEGSVFLTHAVDLFACNMLCTVQYLTCKAPLKETMAFDPQMATKIAK